MVAGRFLELDRPNAGHPVPIRVDSGSASARSIAAASLTTVPIDLPVGPPPVSASSASIGVVARPLGNRNMVTLTVAHADFVHDPPRKVLLRMKESNADPLPVRDIRVIDPESVVVIVDGPPKPASVQGESRKMDVVLAVESATKRYDGHASQVDLAWGPTPAVPKAQLETRYGSTGTLVTVAFSPLGGLAPGSVAAVHFGDAMVPKASPTAPKGWWVEGPALRFFAPAPASGTGAIDVLLVLDKEGAKANGDKARLSVGSFTYLVPAK